MEEEPAVQLAPESSALSEGILPVRIVKEIWREITFVSAPGGVTTTGGRRVGRRALWDSISIASIDEVSMGFSRFVGLDPHFVDWPLPLVHLRCLARRCGSDGPFRAKVDPEQNGPVGETGQTIRSSSSKSLVNFQK